MFTERKTFLYKHLKRAAMKMPTAESPPFHEPHGGDPSGRGPGAYSAAEEAGDVTGLTSKIPKSPNRYQKGSFVLTVHLHLQLYPSEIISFSPAT